MVFGAKMACEQNPIFKREQEYKQKVQTGNLKLELFTPFLKQRRPDLMEHFKYFRMDSFEIGEKQTLHDLDQN